MPIDISITVLGINNAIEALRAAHTAGQQPELQTALGLLDREIEPIDPTGTIRPLIQRLAGGRSAVSKKDLEKLVKIVASHRDRFEKGVDPAKALAAIAAPIGTKKGGGVLGELSPYLLQITGRHFRPRPEQRRVIQNALRHFAEENRGVFRLDTGEGKSPTYGFIIQALRQSLPEVFKDCVVVMGCHQKEPSEKLANTIKDIFPDEEVAYLEGGIALTDLEGVTFVAGTYQQLAQEGTSDLLKDWAGKRRILFVLDEADMVVFKGHREDGARTPTWFRILQDFGLFNDQGAYNSKTPHRMLGGSATFDRPDGIYLSTVWGPGNCFYHKPMAEGLRSKTLVPVIGELVEMEVPEGEEHRFREFTHVTREGKIVVDTAKVSSAAGSDYAVKTSVRTALDRMLMKIGLSGQGKAVRRGIGYVLDSAALEKHIRWQRELFELVEKIFRIYQGLSTGRMSVEVILRILGGRQHLDDFGKEMERFLYRREWTIIKPMWEKAQSSLNADKKEGVHDLIQALYTILKVDVRRVKGNPLVATGVWQRMEQDEKDKKIPAGSPPEKWPNLFGNRDATMRAFNAGQIDFLWSIGMLDRGFDEPMASLAVDNAPTRSRRRVVQRVGRILRPPDPTQPHDHTLKPESVYVTVTANLEAHRLDLSVQDLARIFGDEFKPENPVIKIGRDGDGGWVWTTPDPAQLDARGGSKLHVVRVGERTVKALMQFVQVNFGRDYDPEILAYEAGASADEIDRLLRGIKFPKESKLRHYLKNWGADAATITKIMALFHSDRADMQVVYGRLLKDVEGP